MAGEVLVGERRERASKPGQQVSRDVALALVERPRYASRAGDKLEWALRETGVEVAGRLCLDVGAATGGFTDCLLAHGARRVVALDVGRGLLEPRLREDPRVVVLERLNARHLEPGALPFAPSLIVIDVSFISLRKVLAPVLRCAAARFDCLALVKPQFELGPREAPGGVVADGAARTRALVEVGRFALSQLDVSVLGFAPSGVPGPAGNLETFVHLAERDRGGLTNEGELVAAAERAEKRWQELRGEGARDSDRSAPPPVATRRDEGARRAG